MKGQGRKQPPLALSILAGIPVGQRVSGLTPVRKFNTRPSRTKRRCISLLRPAPPFRLSCEVHGDFAAARKKIRGWRPTPVECGEFGKDPAMWPARPLHGLRHAATQHQHACSRANTGLYRARLDVQPYESDSIVHREAPSMNAGRPQAVLDTFHCRPNPRICMQDGLPTFYVLLISSCWVELALHATRFGMRAIL